MRGKLAELPGIGLVLPLAALAAWQAAGATGHIDIGLWATPATVLHAALDAAQQGALARDLLASLQRDVIGLAFGIPLGIGWGASWACRAGETACLGQAFPPCGRWRCSPGYR